MNKVKISNNQIITSGDLNSIGALSQDGIREKFKFLLGGEGMVSWGLKVVPVSPPAVDVVTVQAGVAVAPTGSAYRGNPILSTSQNVSIPVNAGPGFRYDVIQISYREVASTVESRTFINPVSEVEFSAGVNTIKNPVPSIIRTRHLIPWQSPQPGYVALADVKVPVGGGHIFNANDITDRRFLRKDGILAHYAKSRTSVKNQSDYPAPHTIGGGIVWAEIHAIPEGGSASDLIINIDDSIDWRDRYVFWDGFIVKDWFEIKNNYWLSPGLSRDQYCFESEGCDDRAPTKVFIQNSTNPILCTRTRGMLYTGNGWNSHLATESTSYWSSIFEYNALNINEIGRIYAGSSTGQFKFYCNEIDGAWMILKLSYSPKQGHR